MSDARRPDGRMTPMEKAMMDVPVRVDVVLGDVRMAIEEL